MQAVHGGGGTDEMSKTGMDNAESLRQVRQKTIQGLVIKMHWKVAEVPEGIEIEASGVYTAKEAQAIALVINSLLKETT